MSAQALFSHAGDGNAYSPIPDSVWSLPSGQQSSAMAVWSAICHYLRPGSTELRCTDAMLARAHALEGRSLQFLRKGLLALETLELIERKRRRGLRTITVLGRLKGRTRPTVKTAAAPPAPQVFRLPERVSPAELERVRAFNRKMHTIPPT